mmetsp:Transcript_18174/g.25614  ORF Transcript_18174/g.25614 Transcript_18174/m.25614 type:complete len:570 (+) Transcript_18174:268-1977(+)
MSYNVSDAAAYAVLYSVLIIFTIFALGSADMLVCIPESIARFFCSLNKSLSHEKVRTADYFLSARNSASSFTLAMSFFASGMGAWVVYGTTEMGATPSLSWLGVLGYSAASAFPALLICWLGPKVREMSEDAFSTTDFGRQRYGRVMQLSVAAVSVFYMFIFIVAELTSISLIYGTLVSDFSKRYGISITVSLGAFTVFYTTLAGLPASIVTDRFQGIIMAFLVLMLTISVSAFPDNKVSRDEFALASKWTGDGAMAAVTLFIAIACAELFNQGTWQRVWAAESTSALRSGFMLGSFLVFLLMMFFGIMAMIAYANDPEAYDNFEKYAYLAFFDLLEPMDNGWHIMVLILVTALAASSIDSLQNGLLSIFSSDIIHFGLDAKLFSRILLVAANIPAIWLATDGYDVISLFLVADLVCATSVFPLFLGLQTEDKFGGLLTAPTEAGAFLGCLSGIGTVLVNGVVNDAEGGIFDYFWLRNGDICLLCGSKTMVSFVITPIVSCVATYFFSLIDVKLRGDRARQPIFILPFDDKERNGGLDQGGKVGEEDAEEGNKQDNHTEDKLVSVEESA